MQPHRPFRAGTLHRQRQLRAVSPLALARPWVGHVRGAPSDALERVPNDAPLAAKLCSVRDVLQLASTASIERVVRAWWIHAIGRRDDQRLETPTSKALDRLDADARKIAGCGARREYDESLAASDAVAAGSDAVNLELDDLRRRLDRHRCASIRPARFQASVAAAGAAATDASCLERREPRSRSARSAAAIAAIRGFSRGGSTASKDGNRRSSH